MIKTQIQIPEDLYKDLKRLAKRKEWSLAETLRRAGENFLQQYTEPEGISKPSRWTPPAPRKLGWKGLSPEQLKEAAMEDREACLH
ncbi:MAG: antitoxin [Opitutales bacterium]